MRGAILLIVALVVFLAGIGWWSFRLTDGLADPSPAGLGAVAAAGIGGALLIALFLWLRTRR